MSDARTQAPALVVAALGSAALTISAIAIAIAVVIALREFGRRR